MPGAESNFQLRVDRGNLNIVLGEIVFLTEYISNQVRKAPSAERNFQLRLKKRGFPRAENNFQLRVCKKWHNSPPKTNQIQNKLPQVRKGFPAAENNFQLRVRKALQSFHTRVRKPSLAERNFQLRVRKRSGWESRHVLVFPYISFKNIKWWYKPKFMKLSVL